MNEQSAVQEELPRTAYLDHTLRRARTAAEHRSHRYVTLEHLLLALLDDPDAATLLQVTGADVAVIHSTVADAVNNRMASLVVPDGRSPSFSYRFDSLFACATADAGATGRPQIDGALALIAVSKDAESNASGILSANGFSPEVALQALRTPRPPQAAGSPQKPKQSRSASSQDTAHRKAGCGKPPSASLASEAARLSLGGDSMDDMIASVRTILEAEELKERQITPHLKADGGAPERAAEPAPRAEPCIGPAPQAKRALPRPGGQRIGAFAEPPAPAFDLENTPKAEKHAAARNAARAKAASIALAAKIIETIPRKARVAVRQRIEIRLSKEEAGILFAQVSRRGPHQGAEPVCRAITIRLSAPEGKIFIESLTPETQWLAGAAPVYSGEEAFGIWAWSAMANAIGSHGLKVSMSARGVDANGLAGVVTLPDQTIRLRVRGDLWLSFGRMAREVLLLLAGSGLTVAAAYYWLKATGKLGQFL